MTIKYLPNIVNKLRIKQKWYKPVRCGSYFQTQKVNFCTKIISNSNILNDLNKDNLINPAKDLQRKLPNGPNLKDFLKNESVQVQENLIEDVIPYLEQSKYGSRRRVFFDVYGCQMNVNDTEIIWSILKKHNFLKTDNLSEADIVLIVTCAIRDGAESKIWKRLDFLKSLKQKRSKKLKPLRIGLLGCMAERLKHKLLEKENLVDLIAGPDSYRDIPRLLALTENDQKSINVLLSIDETYADIMPIRLNENAISAFVTIMRGCDNMCTYCIVPFTRGRERSRPISSIVEEVKNLSEQGVKEITLLGQNVNSYRDVSVQTLKQPTNLARGFSTVYKSKLGGIRFADLLYKIAEINPEIRIRFTSPHPKDFPDEVLEVIKSKPNICKNLHMPAQSGNSQVLERMRRGYTRESYLELIKNVRQILPNVGLSSDFICGFCDETDEEFQDTISLLETVKYNTAYLFAYSMREKTTAHRRFTDNVSDNIKQKRLTEMIKTFRFYADKLNRAQIGRLHLVLIESFSKKSHNYFAGRNDQNIKVILPCSMVSQRNGSGLRELKIGDYVAVQINDANSQVLKGIPLYYTSLVDFYNSEMYMEDFCYYHSLM